MNQLCVITAPQNKGWILDRIGHEVGQRYENGVLYCYDINNIPEMSYYFITHYSLVTKLFLKYPKANAVTFFTHESVSLKPLLPYLKMSTKVIVASHDGRVRLNKLGLQDDLIAVVPEGADPQVFSRHERNNGNILVSGRVYDRKRSWIIKEIVEKLPDKQFIFVGEGWRTAIGPHNNCSFIENLEYQHYPQTYYSCDIYLSTSSLEGGGPNALIESMHCNMVPVVSDTGNAREYIVHGSNGFIIGIDKEPSEYVKCIKEAMSLKDIQGNPVDVRKTVEFYTWDNFSKEIIGYLTKSSYEEDQNLIQRT